MKTLFKTLLILSLVFVLAAAGLGVGLVSWLSDAPGMHISINGDEMGWSSGMDFGDVLGAGIGLVVAAVVTCVVVPLALLLGLGLPLLIMGGLLALGLAALVGVGALLSSPLLLVVLVVWLLVRDNKRKGSIAK